MVLAPVLLIRAALRAGETTSTTVTVEVSLWVSQVHCPGEVVQPAGIGTRWHDMGKSGPIDIGKEVPTAPLVEVPRSNLL